MSKFNNVSMAVVRRLPKYFRYLTELLENDVKRISSRKLSEITGFTASQIRQDLNNFGGFGQQGYGYKVEELHRELKKILGLNKKYNTVLVGAGNLGQAIADYKGFEEAGFNILAMFDLNPKLIGLWIRDIEIKDVDTLEQFCEDNDVEIAIICTPKEGSQDIANKLVKSGVRAIWNFSPIDLKVPEDVIVENVHLDESLFTISYSLGHKLDI